MADNQENLKYAEKLAEKQKEQVRIQMDYNEAIKMSSSINKAIQTDIENSLRANAALTDKAKEYLGELKSSVNELSSSEDIAKKLVNIEKEKTKISQNQYSLSQAENDEIRAQLEAAEKVLNIEHQRVAVIEKVNKVATELSETMGGAFDGLIESVKDLPLVGKALSGLGKMGTDVLKQKLGNAAMQFTTNFAGGLRNGMGVMESLGAAAPALGASLTAALASPLLIIGLVVAALAAGIMRFTEIDSAAKQFRESTGLLNSQTKGLQKNIQTISTDMAGLGVSAQEVAEAAGEFTNEFGGLEQPAKGTLESMVMLNKNFGIGFSEASKLNKVFQNMGNLTEAQAQSMTNSVVEMSKMAGVAPSKVVADIANNSEIAYKYFRGGPKELAKAAVSLAAMGSSLESAAKSSESLLDFENSITSELEASAMLGKQLNFDKARTAAFNGDLYGQEKAIMEQLQGIGDISKMNVYQKEALTKATGKEVSELLNLQRIQEKFPNLDETRLAAANALLDSGKDISKLTEADLDAQTQRMAKEKEMQSVMDDLSNKVSAMGTALMDAFLPLGQIAIPLIGIIIDIFGGFVKGVIQPIGNAFSRIFKQLQPIGDLFSKIFGGSEVSILSKTFEVIGNILGGVITFALNYMYGTFQSIVNVVSGIADIIMGIVTLDFSRMGKGFLSVFEGVLGFIYRIPVAIYRTIVDIFPQLGTAFSDFFSSIAEKIKTFFTDILPDFGGLFGGSKSDTSAVQKEALDSALGTDSSGYQVVDDSVNDGIIQNGKVISTNPKDTLIATQNPSQLASGLGDDSMLGNLMNTLSSAAGMVGSVMTPDALKFDELIAEIKGLRADLTGGKVGVNMDGKKVTAGVSRVVTQTTGNAYALK
jgi:hypothetical protein